MNQRQEQARCFGQQSANHFIAACIDDPERYEMHMQRYARCEREYKEWLFAGYCPELVS